MGASEHEGDVAGVITYRCVARRLWVRVAEAPGRGESFTITLRKNLTADTGIKVRIVDDATYAENVEEDVEFNVGDVWALTCDKSPGAKPCRIVNEGAGVEFMEIPEGHMIAAISARKSTVCL